jgi:hypothetical protein
MPTRYGPVPSGSGKTEMSTSAGAAPVASLGEAVARLRCLRRTRCPAGRAGAAPVASTRSPSAVPRALKITPEAPPRMGSWSLAAGKHAQPGGLRLPGAGSAFSFHLAAVVAFLAEVKAGERTGDHVAAGVDGQRSKGSEA